MSIEVKSIEGSVTGVSIGFSALDRTTGGFQKSDLIIVGGRPGMGKTAVALNFALNAAIAGRRESGKDSTPVPTAFFSLEMNADQVRRRLLCQLGRHDIQELRAGRQSDEDIKTMTANAELLNNSPIFIDDARSLSPNELSAKAGRLKSRLKSSERNLDLGLIIVDYLQLMRTDVSHNNRKQEIREISGALKSLAEELSVPVIALSQLRRYSDPAPSFSDFREDASIVQDADLVMFVVRPELLKKDDPSLKGKAELRITKNRSGPTGAVSLHFIAESVSFVPHTRFEPLVDL
ncbi:MAG: DnaB-like helicase C-terminal domain-containing protein [Deltaproteobacteria bacterium]|nr:DnaB-like helicase C-terminal domain-containing protein [Deltaproteobacteria bacterium]